LTRITARSRRIVKLKAVKLELLRRHSATVTEYGRYLRSVLLGHWYYGVPFNVTALKVLRQNLSRIWKAIGFLRPPRSLDTENPLVAAQ